MNDLAERTDVFMTDLPMIVDREYPPINARFIGGDNEISGSDRAICLAYNQLVEMDQDRRLLYIELTGFVEQNPGDFISIVPGELRRGLQELRSQVLLALERAGSGSPGDAKNLRDLFEKVITTYDIVVKNSPTYLGAMASRMIELILVEPIYLSARVSTLSHAKGVYVLGTEGATQPGIFPIPTEPVRPSDHH